MAKKTQMTKREQMRDKLSYGEYLKWLFTKGSKPLQNKIVFKGRR